MAPGLPLLILFGNPPTYSSINGSDLLSGKARVRRLPLLHKPLARALMAQGSLPLLNEVQASQPHHHTLYRPTDKPLTPPSISTRAAAPTSATGVWSYPRRPTTRTCPQGGSPCRTSMRKRLHRRPLGADRVYLDRTAVLPLASGQRTRRQPLHRWLCAPCCGVRPLRPSWLLVPLLARRRNWAR